MEKYEKVFKQDNITIYDTPTSYMFTVNHNNHELTRLIDKSVMTLKDIIDTKWDIEYDIINTYN